MDKFFIEKRIYYHDTDCGGVVYYANYLKHLEEARTEYCIKKGVNLKQLGENGIYFVVARVEIDYKTSARYGDIVRVTADICEVKRSALKFYQQMLRGSSILIQAYTTWVCVGKDFKPISIPREVKDLLILRS